MKKLLIMNDLIFGGGVEKVMMNIINHLPKDKYKVTILTPKYDSNFFAYYGKNIEYLSIDSFDRYLMKGSTLPIRAYNKIMRKINKYKMERTIEKSKFEIAIAIKEGPCMKFIGDLNINKKVAWVHVDYERLHWTKGGFNEGEELAYMKRFNHVICVSNRVKQSVIQQVGDPGNLIFRENPIDEREIIGKSTEFLAYEKSPDIPLFMSIGRLSKVKGYDMLLKACAKLNEQNFKYKLDIIGDGVERERLNNFIKEKRLDNVRLLGQKSNPYKYLKHADWFISASRSEGFALVTQEAAILGVPIIATDCSGVKELLGFNNEYGIVTEISEDSIYNNMLNAIENKNLQSYYKEKIIERSKMISINHRMNSIQKLL